jgi:hypothetical protein
LNPLIENLLYSLDFSLPAIDKDFLFNGRSIRQRNLVCQSKNGGKIVDAEPMIAEGPFRIAVKVVVTH